MKTLNNFINEKLKITKDTKISNSASDAWVLINGPAWSNFGSENTKFRKLFNDRIFEIESRDRITGGVWMQMVMVKISELETVKDIYHYRNLPRAYELPDNFNINASNKEIKEFIKAHDGKAVSIDDPWNYNNLKIYNK